MKNKRWKREAKRLVGHCQQFSCVNCPSEKACYSLSQFSPWTMNLREFEQLCKGK